LRERFPEVTFVHVTDEADALREIAAADVALSSRLSAQIVQNAPRLQWVHSTASAVASLPLAELVSRKVTLTNSRGIQAVAMAEHVMGGLLLLRRRFHMALDAQRERRWIQNELSSDPWPAVLDKSAMTILGLGTTGIEVARRAHAFGMRVTGIRRQVDQPRPEFVDRVLGPDSLDAALRGCDVLVVSAPALAETDRIIGAARIALLNRGAIIANVARGRIVDESAMIAALESGHLGGAVLDVFDREPLDPASPLWTAPNVIITPHSSGFRADHWNDVIDFFSENLRRFQRGEPLLNLVDTNRGY
jgi:phosphoglycerate dehydrogenase-like enzyme